MAPGRVVVRLNPGCSDGDPLHVPPPGTHSQVNPPTLYLEKIGQQWMEQRGEALPGVQYILEALPAGYTMWHRPRPSDPKHTDKYLLGHPGHKRFDSPNRFYPHFEHLMDNNGSNIGCPCTVCRGSAAGILPRVAASPNSSRMRTSSASSRRSSNVSASPASLPTRPNRARGIPTAPRPIAQGRPKKSAGLDTTNVDQDGSPDVYRNLIDKLRKHGQIDEAVREPLSPDWRAEQERLPKLLDTLRSQQQWIPRNGDIVLYVQDLPEGVVFARSHNTNELHLYHQQSETFLGHPKWKAGLVTEVAPRATIADLVDPPSDSNVSNSGLRVEPIPNPNDSDKTLSKRYKYVSLRQTFPFFLWKELLHSAQDEWHPSIKNALALSSTLSLMGKYRFRGTWPNAIIYCHGIFVGSEMLAVGDTVRLLPNSKSTTSECSDIMNIKSIRLKWSNLDKASSNDYDEGRPYNSEIWIYGSAYTSDVSRSNKAWLSLSDQDAQIPRVANDYASFQPLHPPDKELAVPYSRVLGRLFESDAMDYFLGFDSNELPGLDLGQQAMVEARAFARKNDKRIAQEANATWYWGDDRADALNLHTINGLDVSKFNPERDVKALRKQYRIIDSATDGEPVPDLASGAKVLRRFMAPTLPVQTANAKGTSAGQKSSPGSTSHDSSMIDKKRTHTVDLVDDELEDEIRRHTRIIDNDHARPNKTAKISVVID
ncbi:transcription-silencing protein clr2 [Stemphylium lycopersici]|uniref:Transcription-silencing protein clr2 n=1 Tax=Stemphylium lycopersici TaxID=183478 RepID=A0A364MXR9_STELY|nr:transcription-silencing protein clr2 [Stemphylium lycopersici]